MIGAPTVDILGAKVSADASSSTPHSVTTDTTMAPSELAAFVRLLEERLKVAEDDLLEERRIRRVSQDAQQRLSNQVHEIQMETERLHDKAKTELKIDDLLSARYSEQLEALHKCLAEEITERRVENKMISARIEAVSQTRSDQNPPKLYQDDALVAACREELKAKVEALRVRLELRLDAHETKLEVLHYDHFGSESEVGSALQSSRQPALDKIHVSALESQTSGKVDLVLSRLADLEERAEAADNQRRQLKGTTDDLTCETSSLAASQERLKARFDDAEGERCRKHEAMYSRINELAQIAETLGKRLRIQETAADNIAFSQGDLRKYLENGEHLKGLWHSYVAEFEENAIKKVTAETTAKVSRHISEAFATFQEDAAKTAIENSEKLLEANALLREELHELKQRPVKDGIASQAEEFWHQQLSVMQETQRKIAERVDSQGRDLVDLQKQTREEFLHKGLIAAADMKVAKLAEKLDLQATKLEELMALVANTEEMQEKAKTFHSATVAVSSPRRSESPQEKSQVRRSQSVGSTSSGPVRLRSASMGPDEKSPDPQLGSFRFVSGERRTSSLVDKEGLKKGKAESSPPVGYPPLSSNVHQFERDLSHFPSMRHRVPSPLQRRASPLPSSMQHTGRSSPSPSRRDGKVSPTESSRLNTIAMPPSPSFPSERAMERSPFARAPVSQDRSANSGTPINSPSVQSRQSGSAVFASPSSSSPWLPPREILSSVEVSASSRSSALLGYCAASGSGSLTSPMGGSGRLDSGHNNLAPLVSSTSVTTTTSFVGNGLGHINPLPVTCSSTLASASRVASSSRSCQSSSLARQYSAGRSPVQVTR